jgi:predicted nucleotide-binding protein
LKNIADMEKPSDINGLIYMPFTNDVKETTVDLAKEMKKNGYYIDVSKL